MKLSVLGAIQIAITPLSDNKEIMSVEVIAENRKETITAKTNRDETVDQFTQRLKGILRAMLNAELRETVPVTVPEDVRNNQTWEEQKAALKAKK